MPGYFLDVNTCQYTSFGGLGYVQMQNCIKYNVYGCMIMQCLLLFSARSTSDEALAHAVDGIEAEKTFGKDIMDECPLSEPKQHFVYPLLLAKSVLFLIACIVFELCRIFFFFFFYIYLCAKGMWSIQNLRLTVTQKSDLVLPIQWHILAGELMQTAFQCRFGKIPCLFVFFQMGWWRRLFL